MTQGQYKFIGSACLIAAAALAFYWSYTHTGLAAFFLDLSKSLFDTELVQFSWVFTFLILCVPGYYLKRYFDNKAWDLHVASLPPPDKRDSAKRSKYVQMDAAMPPAPPKPVEMNALPQGQAEFIATCPGCGHLFSARRDIKDLRCPACGDPIPVA